MQKQETKLSWSQQGPAGPQGLEGPAGPPGPEGPSGVAAIYTREQTFVVPEDTAGFARNVSCDVGDVAIGGGWSIWPDMRIVTSRRAGVPETWRLEVSRDGLLDEREVTFRATCVSTG